jgi:hypothetical protein
VNKKHYTFYKLIFLSTCLFLTSCSPFGKGSRLNFKNFPSLISSEQTNSDINSGGTTAPTIPQSGLPADIHSVSYKLGSPFKHQTQQTANGGTVSILGVSR